MFRASRSLAGLLLSLCVAACGSDVTVGLSELESLGGNGDAGAGSDAEGGGLAPDASDDDLSRIAQELSGSWSFVAGDRTFTFFLTHVADRKGTLSLECTRGGQDCTDAQDGGISIPFPPAFLLNPRGDYFVLERKGSKIDGVVLGLVLPWEFVYEPARQAFTLTAFGVSFLRDDPPRTPSKAR